MFFTAELNRFKKQAHPELQTLGTLTVFNEDAQVVVHLRTLELPDKDNKTNISCIPAGDYWVKPRTSKKYGKHFHITDVEGRSYILIHSGNYYTQIRGCVLVGLGFKDINGDAVMDVTSSKPAMNKLLKAAPKGFQLTISE